MHDLLEKRHAPLCAALNHAMDLMHEGQLSPHEADAFYRLVARDHALNCMTPEDHAEARQKGGLVDRLGKLEKLSDEDEELALRAERKIAVSMVGKLVEDGKIGAKTGRELLGVLIDLTDHENDDGDDQGVISSLALMALIAADGLKPAKAKAAPPPPKASEQVTPREAREFKRRNGRR